MNIEIKQPQKPHTITFQTDDDEMIKITKGKFYWKGEEVKDTKKVYERFSEWLESQGK